MDAVVRKGAGKKPGALSCRLGDSGEIKQATSRRSHDSICAPVSTFYFLLSAGAASPAELRIDF